LILAVAEPALYLYARISPKADRRLLVRPEFKAMFLDDLLNGSRKQLAAPFADVVVFARDWDSGWSRSRCRCGGGTATATTAFRSRMVNTSSAGCLTPSCTTCPAKTISLVWAAPRKSCAR
jgi:hypothetical protein